MSTVTALPALPDTFRVPFDGGFRVGEHESAPGTDGVDKKSLKKELAELVKRISEAQKLLFADDRFAVLLVFQAMDAAGKDGTIRAVMSGVNPAGCQVSSFKAPTDEELEHDWLWRTVKRLPERGRIGIFNRSYYEEVLAVRVNESYLDKQRLPALDSDQPRDVLWQQRFESIRDHELHLARNGTVILKFWLDVSRDEQSERFLSRLTNADKYWKFNEHDLSARDRWDDYMQAYEALLNETSRAYAPWYAIPADDKPFMRVAVARIVAQALESLPLQFPEKSAEELARFNDHIARLKGESS